MITPDDVAALELLAARSWRGLEEERLGDWLLRAAGGFTGRANSVLVVGRPPSGLPETLPGTATSRCVPAGPRRASTGSRPGPGMMPFQVAPAIVVSDSFGRAWRQGQSEVAIGCAGLAPLEDWRGQRDSTGRVLRATWIAVADQAAAAADLARRKDSREPVVLVRGLERHVTAHDGPGAAALVRPEQQDLFR